MLSSEKQNRKWLVLGMAGVLLSFLCVALLYSATVRWKGTADSLRHLDYAWQLSQGNFPVWKDGTRIPADGWVGTPQFVSHHPPLYYAYLAPFVGRAVESGGWTQGVLVARLLTSLIGLLCVLSFAWVAWIASDGSARLALVTAAFGASWVPFSRVSGDVMNDTMVVLATSLTMGVLFLIIRRGISLQRMVALACFIAMGMASRATFLGIAGIAIAGAGWVALFRSDNRSRAMQSFAIGLVATVVLTALTSGWFYYWNFEASGSWHRNSDQSWVASAQGRKLRGLWATVTSYVPYTQTFTNFYGRPWIKWGSVNYWASCLAAVFTGVVLLISLLKRRNADWLVLGILVALFGVNVFFQIWHAKGYGAFNVRYMLPSMIVVALAVGYAVTRFNGNLVATFFILISWAFAVGNLAWYLEPDGDSAATAVSRIARNGFLVWYLYALLAGVGAGAVLQIFALGRLRSS